MLTSSEVFFRGIRNLQNCPVESPVHAGFSIFKESFGQYEDTHS